MESSSRRFTLPLRAGENRVRQLLMDVKFLPAAVLFWLSGHTELTSMLAARTYRQPGEESRML